MQIVCFIGALLFWLIILGNSKIGNRPRESQLEKIRNLWLVLAFSFVFVLIVNTLAFQLLPAGGYRQCSQQQVDCETLYSIIGAAQSYCMATCPFLVILSFMYLLRLIGNIISAEKSDKAKRKKDEF